MAESSNLITALGAGSGVDIKALAQGLVDAEKVPRQNAIQAKLDKSEAKISGYSAMMAAIDVFKASVEQVDSTTDFASTTARVSNASALSVSTSSLAAPGSHSISINSLAQAQRSNSDTGFSNITSQVNGGAAFNLTFTVGPVGSQTTTTVSIDQASTNLSAVASAINLSDAGISAQVLDTGVINAADRYRLVLTGLTGEDNVFQVSSTATDPTEFAFSTPAGQEASDASLTVNGVGITRSTNTIDDVITGVTLDLQATTSTATSLTVVRDATGVKEKIQGIVEAYNNLVSDFGVLSGPKSDDPDDVFSGSLRGDSTVRTVLSQIRQIFFGESETAGDTVKSFRDLGVSVDKDGVVTLDEATLDAALSTNFEEVVQVLAARQSTVEDDETVVTRGLGVTLAARLRELMSPSGIIVSQSTSAESQVSRYETQLEDLEDRMTSLLERYTKQFAAMESLVGQISAMRENLKGQFESLANAYKD